MGIFFLSIEKRLVMKYGNDLQKSMLNHLNHCWMPVRWLPGTVLGFRPRNASMCNGLTGWGEVSPCEYQPIAFTFRRPRVHTHVCIFVYFLRTWEKRVAWGLESLTKTQGLSISMATLICEVSTWQAPWLRQEDRCRPWPEVLRIYVLSRASVSLWQVTEVTIGL